MMPPGADAWGMPTTTFNVFYTLAGIAVLLVGGQLTRAYIRSRVGRFDRETMDAVVASGVVPRWVSFMTLAGWFMVVTGVLSLVAIPFAP